MTCKNCDPKIVKPAHLVEASIDHMRCAICGEELYKMKDKRSVLESRWDSYFYQLCETVASKSPCLSRKIGAILVKDHSIVSTGYNGPPRGIPHCGLDRFMEDNFLFGTDFAESIDTDRMRRFRDECPRKVLGYESGAHMELCPAQHAEENVVSNAARNGVSVLGTTLYMNSVIPCQKCYGTLINAGIREIVVEKAEVYDKHTQFLIDNSNIVIMEFSFGLFT